LAWPLSTPDFTAEDEINRTQKNKATEYHVGQLKARLAKLRTQLLEPGGGGGGGGGFDVAKSGDARVALVRRGAFPRECAPCAARLRQFC
jgi:ribosome-interacting GTPase 1